jgi:hypothetical protein
MFKDFAIILDAIRRSFFFIFATAAAMFTSVRVDFGRPPLSSSLPAPFRLKITIPPKSVLSVHSLIPISLLHQY